MLALQFSTVAVFITVKSAQIDYNNQKGSINERSTLITEATTAQKFVCLNRSLCLILSCYCSGFLFKNGPILPSRLYYTIQFTDKLLPLLGFEQGVSGVRTDRFANCAKTTAPIALVFLAFGAVVVPDVVCVCCQCYQYCCR